MGKRTAASPSRRSDGGSLRSPSGLGHDRCRGREGEIIKEGNLMRRLTVVIAAVALLSACAQRPLTTQEKGAVTGAALGAGTGAIIGSATGRAGARAAIGAGLGLLTGPSKWIPAAVVGPCDSPRPISGKRQAHSAWRSPKGL